jgi:hypothetical protein
MSMHMIRGVQIHGKSMKGKKKNLTEKQIQKLKADWRAHNKDMRRKNMHSCQFENFDDYVKYTRGEYKSPKKEFKTYEQPKTFRAETKDYPSGSPKSPVHGVPGSGTKKEYPKYTGDLIVGIGVMHKSNLVPIMRGTNEAKDIASMRR